MGAKMGSGIGSGQSEVAIFHPTWRFRCTWPDQFGPGVREGWVKMNRETSFNTLFMGSLADNWFTLPTAYPADDHEAIAAFHGVQISNIVNGA